MWIFTKDGFYSAVWNKHCRRDEVMIRSQSKEDLSRLIKKIRGYCDESKIIEIEQVDYRFRIKIPKDAWSDYLADCALHLDYPEVKNHILPDGDQLRKDAYYQIWQTIYRWRTKMDTETKDGDGQSKGIKLLPPFRWKK